MPAFETPGLWTLGFLGVLGLTIAWVLLRSLAPRPAAPPSATPSSLPSHRPAAILEPAGPPEEALRQTARELAARLDEKICRLESLLCDADRVADRLEAAVAAAGPHSTEARRAARGSTSAPTPPTGFPSSEPVALPPEPLPRGLPGQAQGLQGASASPTRRPAILDRVAPTQASSSPPSHYDKVLALSDRGHTAQEIASRTGIPLGEVQLVLNLRRMRASAGP